MKTWNIAHRGGAGLMPENTLAAFRHAIALDCDGAELDVQLSADGVVVVHHDFRLNPALTRKDGRWLESGTPRVKDLTLAELQAFDLGRADPASDYARLHPALVPVDGARIPALGEVAALTSPRLFILLVELKSSGDPGSADPVALADAALGGDEGSARPHRSFVGFDWRGLARIKSRAPECTMLVHHRQIARRCASRIGYDQGGRRQWLVPLPTRTRSPDMTAEARARGLQVAAWTVNDPARDDAADRAGA